MFFHKKISFIFLISFVFVLVIASFFKLNVHSLTKISLVSTVYAEWWDDFGVETEDTGDEGGGEETDPGRDNWWDDNNDGNDGNDDGDNENNNQCNEESWTDEETSGEFYCNDGKACYKQWSRDSECNIHSDGEDCQNDSRCQQENEQDNNSSCDYKYKYPECQADGQVYEVWQDCNGDWDPRPTGQSCGGGEEEDQEESQGACGENQYWSTSSGQCEVNELEQTKINDEIYCREQCNNSCTGGLGHMRCTEPDGSYKYDCTNPLNQADLAECQNVVEEEFQHIGIDPDPAGAGDLAVPLCTTSKVDGGECNGSEYCSLEAQYCQGEITGNPVRSNNCNLVPNKCGVAADENGKLYIERAACNPECGENETCRDDGNGAGFCQANTEEQAPITVVDSEHNIRVEGNTLRIGEGTAGVSDCQNISDYQEKHNCLVEYAKSHIEDFTGKTASSLQSGPSDTTCQAQNSTSHYCDGNVCIEKSSGWDGNACVDVYKTVSQSNCNNSCSSDIPQSGQDIKLLSCLDETDSTKRSECNQENARIVQTGQRLDQSSLIKASLEISDCESLEGEAKEACQNKNQETRFLGRVLDTVRLENCSNQSGDEKAACDKRNTDAIRAGQIRLNLGIEDCSTLTGDKKTNCEFTNYRRDQITQAVISFKAEDCSVYQTDEEKTKCLENNQKGLSQAVSNSSPFVGLAEVGASCVYTEACAEGGKKACAGKVASDNGAPVCRYDAGAASCSACTNENLNLSNQENKCSEDGQTCLNGPGVNCITDAQCQGKLAAAQQAAANAPIDSAKYFSQQFEEGASCKQVQTCDDGTEQVCEGKGANGVCDLSLGGGICSPCQAKGTITLNKVATCNAENKCEGAPALSGCMNDEQCKPVVTRVATGSQVTGYSNVPTGGTVGNDGFIYQTIKQCDTQVQFTPRVNQADDSNADDARFFQIYDNEKSNLDQCVDKIVNTGQRAQPIVVTTYTDKYIAATFEQQSASRQAITATNQLDNFYAQNVLLDPRQNPQEVAQDLAVLQLQQKQSLDRLLQAQANLNSISLQPTTSLAAVLDRSTLDQKVAAGNTIVEVQDQDRKVQVSLYQTAQARAQYNQFAEADPFSAEANQAYLDFEAKRQQTISNIDQLASLRGEIGEKTVAPYRQQLDQLPTKADEQFKDQKTVSETNQLSNLARQSNSPEVIMAAQNALTNRVEETERRGNVQLAANLQRQGVQASFEGWLNVYASELSKPGGDSEKGGTSNTQLQIQNLIEVASASDPQVVQKMEQEYAALPNFVAALNLANEIKRETVGTFAGTVTQDNNSAFYSAIANAEEQAKSREDLANLVDRTCALSAQRCTNLQIALGITTPNATADQIADAVVSNSQSDAARAANLLVEQSRLLPQLYQVERSGDANNIEQLSSLLGRSNQIKAELAQIDPNLALRAQAQVQEVIAQGKAQNQLDYATNTYANNKELLLAFDKASRNDIGGLNGVDPVAEAEAARARMQSAIDQMRSVNPEKADALQNDLDLTKFKLESFERGNAMVNSDGCVIEACQGNGSSAQNICTGQVAESKSFNRICAAKNGVVNPGEAAQLELAANLQSVAQPAKVVNENQLTLNSLWQGAVTLPSTIGSMFTDWRARATEGSIPVFIGTPEEQLACRDLWQNTRVQGAQQIQRGESSLGCTIDSRSSEEKALQAAQIANNGGTVKDIFSSLEGVKAESELRQRTLQRAAEEAGVSLDTPMAYWTPTQRDKFYEKLKGLDNAGSIDVFDAIIFPTAALSEVQSAMERCTKDWGKDLCQLDSNLASTYQGIAQADGPIYDQAIKNAKVLNPGIADVPQSDFAWVVDGISKQQRGGVIDLLTAGSVPTRDQFESDDAYYRAITADLAEKGGTGLTREQLINRLLLDANRQGITSADGSAMSREDIANAVDAYLAIGDFGRNVVNTSEAYQWQRAATTEFNWQLAQDVVGLATIAGPLEMLDPTNPIVELAIKGVTKSVSVPARAVTGVFDNVLERIGTNTAKNVLEETAGYGLSRVESNAVAAFYDGRVAGKTVSQSIAELSPSQQLAFGQATDKIGTRLGLTETPDHLIASTVLDTILTQKVDPAQIASQVVRQTDIDALAAQMQKRIETPPFEGAEAVRARIIDGQVEGVRLGQATDEENAAINHLLKTSPSDNPVEKWRNLTPPQQQDIVQQAAREMEIARAVAQREAELTPTNGNQALIQLAEQSKAVSAGNTSPALTNALTSASVVLPKVAEVVVKMADGTPLNALDRRALELAGVSESSLRKNIDPLNQTAKLKVASVVTADPAVLAKTDLETTLLNQGLTSHQASMLATSLQPLAPTPPAPAAQPGFLARLADTWNTLTGRNSTPVSQTIPNTNTVANTNTNQTPPQTTATFSVNDSGSAAFENRRGGQGRPAYPRQDRDVVQTQFRGNENEGLFAVFDGHGTNADQLAQNLTDKLPLKIKDKLSKGKSVEEALIETFKEMNEELPKDLAIRAGSTGTVVYRNGNDVWIVNVGDSPALLSRNGQVESVYTAHSGVAIGPDPDDPNRVSRVAVDRAFGDKGHTAISTGKEISSEITVADVRKITPTSQDEFIVITSDGVFESDMTEQEAIDIVRSQLQAGKSPQEAAQALAKAAYDQGNTDDITVIVIPLHKAPTAPVPPVAPAAPAVVTPPVQAPTSASTTSPSWWERATSWFRSEPTPTDIDQVVVDRSVIVQKRQLAEAALSTEQAVSEALTQQRKAFNEESKSLLSAQAEVERTVGFYNEVNKKGLLGLKSPDPAKVQAAEKAADEAKAELEKLIQNSETAFLQEREQKVKVARLTIEANNLTTEQIQANLKTAQSALKTAATAEKAAKQATDSDGDLTKALNKARQDYAKAYNALTNGRPPSLEKESEFLQAWKDYQTALEDSAGKETAAVIKAKQNLKIDSVSLGTTQAEDLVSKINGLNEASTQYNTKLYQMADAQTDKAVANEQIATLKSLLSDSKSVETLNTQINDYVLKDLVGPEITTFSSPRPWFLFGGNPTAQVQLYVDKAGGLVTPGVAIPSDAIQVVGVFKKTGNKIVLDHYVVPASISEQSFVFQQLNRTANPGWFSKGVQIEKDGTRFTQLYDAAESPALASRVSAPVVDPNLSYKIDLTPDLTNAALQLRLAGDNGELPENTKVLAWLKSIDRGVDQVDTTDARLVVIGFNDGRQPLALDTYEVKALIKQPSLVIDIAVVSPIPPAAVKPQINTAVSQVEVEGRTFQLGNYQPRTAGETEGAQILAVYYGPEWDRALNEHLFIVLQDRRQGGFASTSETIDFLRANIISPEFGWDEGRVKSFFGGFSPENLSALTLAAQQEGRSVVIIANDFALRTEVGEATYNVLEGIALNGRVTNIEGRVPASLANLLQEGATEAELADYSKQLLAKWKKEYNVQPTNRYSGVNSSAERDFNFSLASDVNKSPMKEWQSEGFADGIGVLVKQRSGQSLNAYDEFIWSSFTPSQQQILQDAADLLLPPNVVSQTPAAAVINNVADGLHSAADGVRAAGSGTPVQPLTNAVADTIDSALAQNPTGGLSNSELSDLARMAAPVGAIGDVVEVFTQAESISYNGIFNRIPQSIDATINGELAPITLETITDRNAVFTLTLANGNKVSTTLDELVRNPQQFIADAIRASSDNSVSNNLSGQVSGGLRNPQTPVAPILNGSFPQAGVPTTTVADINSRFRVSYLSQGDMNGGGQSGAKAAVITNGQGVYFAKYFDNTLRAGQVNLSGEISYINLQKGGGLYPEIHALIVDERSGEVIGYVMDNFEKAKIEIPGFGLRDATFKDVSLEKKLDFASQLAMSYEYSHIHHGDLKNLQNILIVRNSAGELEIKVIDPNMNVASISPTDVGSLGSLPRGLYRRQELDEFEQVIRQIFTPEEIAADRRLSQIFEQIDAQTAELDRLNSTFFTNLNQNYTFGGITKTGREWRELQNARGDIPGLSPADIMQEQGLIPSRFESNGDAGINCGLSSAPSQSNLAQMNSAANVLGVSTGEVLAASTGPCGPVRNFIEKIFDNPIGRMFNKIKTPINDAADTWDRLISGTTNPETNSIDVSLYMNQIKSDIKKSEFIAATQTIEDVFPGQNFDVFSLAGSSAVIYIDKNDPTLVYKVSIKITPSNRSNLENKIETIRYREEEAKKLQILSEKNLSPKLIEYIPAKYTDEEAKLLADPSFAPREQNQLLAQTTLSKSAKESDREIIVMEKLEKDPIGFSKLSKDPVKKQAEIDKVIRILEETEFFPGDTEMIIDKSGSIKYVDLGGMSPMYPGSRFEGMSIREAVEASFESGIRSERGQMRN